MTPDDKTDTALTDKIKQSLDASLTQIDAGTQQRLDQMRRKALNQPRPKTWFNRYLSSLWAPATGLVFCSVLALLVLVPSQQGSQAPNYADQTAVFELLETADDLETLSDPDFYLWVDEMEQNHAV